MRPWLHASLLRASLIALSLAACSNGDAVNTPADASADAAETTVDTPAPNDLNPPDTSAVDGPPTDRVQSLDVAPDATATDVSDDLAPADATSDTSPDDASDAPVDAAADVPKTPDASGASDASGADVVDVAVDASPARCTADGDCAASPLGPVCDVVSGACVRCTPTRDVCPSGQRCVEGMNVCAAGCRNDAACDPSGTSMMRCDPSTHDCVRCLVDTHCPTAQRCAGNVCVPGCTTAANCATGQSCCGAVCVDTRSNTDHCGACNATCAPPNATPACVSGLCGAGACVAPFADCDGATTVNCDVDTRSDARNCGGCGTVVTLPHAVGACVMGAPAVGSCSAGFGDCDGEASNGCERDLVANNAACGACGRACAAGQHCETGACVSDCRRTGALGCATGTACDYSDGLCRAASARCFLTGAFVACGTQSCGPGSVCDPRAMRCVASLSCRAVSCETSGGRCWGNDCPCDRPPAACTTLAPSAVPPAFLNGAFGFDIDDACNMYTATMLSGPDYVRRVDPMARVTTYTSVANLNMGEVAVQRRINIAPGEMAENVAFTYICCAACGCASGTPQGVGHVQTDGSLPVVVPAVVTTGTGPFGVGYLDTGPYGLSVSALGEFFVGNARVNGDWSRYDTLTRTITAVSTLPARITASTSFNLDTMLVAVSGGELYAVDRAPGGTPRLLGTLGADVQSLRRDAFTGRFYASLRGGRIVSFLPDASGITMESMAARGSRIALSPDGWMYILLEEGGPISRVALPSSR